MGINFRFNHKPKIKITYLEKPCTTDIWRIAYRPSSRIFLQVIEVICVLMYAVTVLSPVQLDAYDMRKALKYVYFLENHESPISSASAVNDYFKVIKNETENIKLNFLMDVDFPNETNLVYHYFTYNNGSEELILNPEIDPESLKDIITIKTIVPIYVFSSKQKTMGCSLWDFIVIISCVKSDPAFFLSSKIIRHKCKLTNGEVKGRKIETSRLNYYIKSMRVVRSLFVASLVHMFIVIKQIYTRWKKHHKWCVSDITYQEMKSSKRYHYTFGGWLIYEMFSSSFILAASIVSYKECMVLTEYPSLLVLQYFAFSTTLVLLSILQLYKFNDYSYHFVEILREGAEMLFNVILGFIPIIFAFFLFGIFMFSNVAWKTHTIIQMIEILVSFTLGDNIMPTYNDFSDGTPVFNWLAFIYITAFVLMAGWIVFASFTATIAFVDQRVMMQKHLKDD